MPTDTPSPAAEGRGGRLPDDLRRRAALRLWREREMRFPVFARRMNPDDLDLDTGAWALAWAEAGREALSREKE